VLLSPASGDKNEYEARKLIVNSGNIVLLTGTDNATQLSDIYLNVENYNHEANRTRDASERSNSLAEPFKHRDI
jgi:hypothetical protein